ncbi:IclR family transcriptional regulator [Tropicimonas sp. IMCC34043]|uniref:IclR family transcriptional regulator n=1 Tax=Tropicimonas sp. IMCC34043 TaxID=2248760 RepID=UPI000E22BA6A|nr:IclR family transcriptional regulator [Tropicimonas sp. IMCC34043]
MAEDLPQSEQPELVAERQTPMKSLHRGLLALQALDEARTLRTVDLAQRLGIDKGLASRILQTLTATGFAERTPDRRYRATRPSSAMTERRTGVALRTVTRSLLQQLCESSGESAHLGVLADDRVVFVERAVPSVALLVDRPVGTLVSLYNSAIGKVFLAHFGVGVAGLPKDDPLLPDAEGLNVIREQGYATDDEELFAGVRCAAAPVFDANGLMVAAISLSGPSSRISSARMHELGRMLKASIPTV